MGFYKDFGGLALFIICQIVFILQFFFIYEMNDEIDNKQNIFLTVHKTINYIFLFLSFFSYKKTALIDPGEITFYNNKEIIDFYYNVHETLINQALYITKKNTPEVIREKILKEKKKLNQVNKEKGMQTEEEDENPSDVDEYKFKPITSINDNLKKIIEEKYHLKLSRCYNCYVVRPLNSHHCIVCHKCYIGHDHHCPWVNNCIGLFNKKIFILFLFYSIIEVIYSDLLFCYYSLYKNISQFKESPLLLVLDIFAIIFGLILVIASFMLLMDLYDTIVCDCNECDFNEGILLEKSSVYQQFQIIFGGIFSYKWLLPFYTGGNKDLFMGLVAFLKKRELLKNKKGGNEENIGELKEVVSKKEEKEKKE